MKSPQLRALGFILFALPPSPLRHRILDEAISRGLFLRYDAQSGMLTPTVEHQALRALRDDIELLERRRAAPPFQEALAEFVGLARRVNQGQITEDMAVDSDKLSLAVSVHDSLENVFNASVQLCKWLLGVAESPAISRRPATPVEGMAQEIRIQSATPDEIRWAIANNVFPFGATLTPEARDVARGAEEHYFQQLREMIPSDVADDDRIRSMIKESLDRSVIEPYNEPPPTTRRARD